MSDATFTNIAAYKFAPMEGLKSLRTRLLGLCREQELKGTILLSVEGINLFVAGRSAGVDALLEELRALPGLEDLPVKYSESASQPFNRMLVRIKKEIIPFGVEGVDPARNPTPAISPAELKRWLDEGRPVTLLDTRNDYEVKLGTFRGALPAGIRHFREFPEAVSELDPSLKERPVVMFCTGGIRCEKAGPYMEREGFRNVRQLDGGILNYFEQCGGAHYEGDCFVFDQRVGVDPALRETEAAVCHRCLTPLTEEEQADPRYCPPDSCPHCYRPPDDRLKGRIEAAERALKRAVSLLPGSGPYENRRPINVPGRFDGATVIDFLCGILPHLGREHWLGECAAGRIRNESDEQLAAESRVPAGERCVHIHPAVVEPPVAADIAVIYEDEKLLVLNKPAPLPVHAGGRYARNTLVEILARAFAPFKPRPVHRLDANTTGVIVCARTRAVARALQPVFASGAVNKRYLVSVVGHPPEDRFLCEAPIGTAPVETGCRVVDADDGAPARTEFLVVRRDADGTALLEARPITGRTNQIRVHLWHLGFPVCGDPSYLADRQLGTVQTLHPEDPPLRLHAAEIEFTPPWAHAPLRFVANDPAWV